MDLDHDAWLEWRRGGIGSSDAPAVLGVCPHKKTRLAVYLDKIGPRPERQTRRTFGNDLEPLIARWYSEKTGVEIVEHQHLAECEVHPWMRASVDCIRADGRAVELKALGIFQANNFQARDGDWERLPASWLVQCHHQMVVLDHDVIDMAVFYPLEVRTYTIPRSEKLAVLIVDLTGELWECVCDRIPPRTVDQRDADRLEEAYPRARGEIVLEGPEFIEAARLWEADKDKAAKALILDAMGEAAVAELPNGDLIRRKQTVVKEQVRKEHVRTILEIDRRSQHAHV